MKRKKEGLVLGKILQKLAPRLGASVVLEPEWRIVGQITFGSGKKSYFRYNTLDLNPVGSSDIAKDKDYANFFMRRLRYPIVEGKAFYSDEWCRAIGSKRNAAAAYRYAKRLGFPVIAKPNSGSQGVGVVLVHTKRELYRALSSIFKSDRVALVQSYVRGKDYRLVVLDKEIISAYERIPLNVVGDGRSTISKLLAKKQRKFRASSRDTSLKLDDPRILQKLRRQKLRMRSVPRRGEQIFLLDNANLSSGGDALDVTHSIHPEFKKIAVALTKDMGLRLAGVDLMLESAIQEKPKKYWVLEINAAPGLDHYVKGGHAQQRIVESLYLKVLKHLAR